MFDVTFDDTTLAMVALLAVNCDVLTEVFACNTPVNIVPVLFTVVEFKRVEFKRGVPTDVFAVTTPVITPEDTVAFIAVTNGVLTLVFA